MIWKELNDNLVFHNLKASDNIEVLQLMGDAMIQEGYGEEGFTEAVLKREKDYPTGLDVNGIGVAIPHTDAEHVKKEGISTAVDTSGVFYLTPGIKEVIELTDLFLLDIKCINDEICRDLTGVSNQKELEFARYLSENGKHMWIRQVLVPGYTDKEEDLKKLKEFLATLKTVDKVEILPYHDMGRFKWEQLGLEYPLDGVRVANNEDVERAKKLLGI